MYIFSRYLLSSLTRAISTVHNRAFIVVRFYAFVQTESPRKSSRDPLLPAQTLLLYSTNGLVLSTPSFFPNHPLLPLAEGPFWKEGVGGGGSVARLAKFSPNYEKWRNLEGRGEPWRNFKSLGEIPKFGEILAKFEKNQIFLHFYVVNWKKSIIYK